MSRLGEWVLGPIEWPRVLVPWRAVDPPAWPNDTSVHTIASAVAVSRQLLADAGIVPGYRRWPSFDDLLVAGLARMMADTTLSVGPNVEPPAEP